MFPNLPYDGYTWQITQHAGIVCADTVVGLLRGCSHLDGKKLNIADIDSRLVQSGRFASKTDRSIWRDYQQVLSEFGFTVGSASSNGVFLLTPIARELLAGKISFAEAMTLQLMRYQYANGFKQTIRDIKLNDGKNVSSFKSLTEIQENYGVKVRPFVIVWEILNRLFQDDPKEAYLTADEMSAFVLCCSTHTDVSTCGNAILANRKGNNRIEIQGSQGKNVRRNAADWMKLLSLTSIFSLDAESKGNRLFLSEQASFYEKTLQTFFDSFNERISFWNSVDEDWFSFYGRIDPKLISLLKELPRNLGWLMPSFVGGMEKKETFLSKPSGLDSRPSQIIYFGAPGTGKSFTLKIQTAPFEEQKKIRKDKKDEIRNAIAEAITKSGKLTLLNSIGFKYSDELKNIQRKDLPSYCEYDKIDELYIGSNAKPISETIQITKDDQLTDIDFIKDLIQNKRGNNNSLKWANAIGFKFGDFLKDWTHDELRKTFELSEPQMWWIYRGAQASQIRSSEIETEIKYVERVTFHPNYSYAQFVGTYKPVQDNDDKKQIKYEYVPGPFMRMYCSAKKNPNNDFLLIIEEINRANVAAVFGDVFQLLDRKKGVSEYPVAASEDVRNYLADNGINDKELCIPKNMYIWATMNSADQGVFPMDTAFKRRWEFEYIDINNNESEIDSFYLPTCIVEKENKCIFENWNSLRKKLNEKLQLIGVNEDKLLGPFFINKDTLEEISSLIEPRKDEKNEEYISVDFQITTDDARSQNKKKIEAFQKSFESKVLMYLYEDMRMYRPDIFQIKVDGKDIDKPRLSQIFKAFERDGIEIFNFSTDRS